MKRVPALIATALAIAHFIPLAARADAPQNVVLITYDGVRWQEIFGGADERRIAPDGKDNNKSGLLRRTYGAETPEKRREILFPFLWGEIAKKGQIFGDAEAGSVARVTNGHNFSYPGYNEILTGFGDPSVDSNAKRNNWNVTVLEWLDKQPGLHGSVAAVASWNVFPFIINVERNGLPVNGGWMPFTESKDRETLKRINEMQEDTPHYWDDVRFDTFTYQGSVEYILKHKPRVMVISFGETDDWAHENRYKEYLDSALRTDQMIERIWKLLQSIPQYHDKTTLLLTTDHGRGDLADWVDHGDDVPGCDRIWAAALGPGVPAKGIVKNTPITQGQIAATMASLLGLDFNASAPNAAPPIPLK
jgi:hypothetical protein